MNIEDIAPKNYKTRSVYTPAKKIDLGDYYLIYVSGVQAPKKETSHEVITNDIAEQTKLVFEDINSILNQCGASLDDVAKAVIYLTDMKEFDIVSSIRAEYFKNSKPVSTVVEVNAMTRIGARIEIEVTAMIKK